MHLASESFATRVWAITVINVDRNVDIFLELLAEDG